jgi:hypothetical protein
LQIARKGVWRASVLVAGARRANVAGSFAAECAHIFRRVLVCVRTEVSLDHSSIRVGRYLKIVTYSVYTKVCTTVSTNLTLSL